MGKHMQGVAANFKAALFEHTDWHWVQYSLAPSFTTACCEACNAFEGWVLIEPISRTWSFTDPTTGMPLQVVRSQLPLMPAEACPLYSLQGATCDPGLIAHFTMPRRADDDIKWLIVYVLLSRVRSLSTHRSVGLKL